MCRSSQRKSATRKAKRTERRGEKSRCIAGSVDDDESAFSSLPPSPSAQTHLTPATKRQNVPRYSHTGACGRSSRRRHLLRRGLPFSGERRLSTIDSGSRSTTAFLLFSPLAPIPEARCLRCRSRFCGSQTEASRGDELLRVNLGEKRRRVRRRVDLCEEESG